MASLRSAVGAAAGEDRGKWADGAESPVSTSAALAALSGPDAAERYRALFHLVPVAVYSCDAGGMIQDYNQRAVELWGREPRRNESAERYCGSFKLYHPDGREMPHDTCPMARVLRGETLSDRDMEILVERPDGVRRNVLAHPQALRDERGNIIGAINCLYDITERKQAEAASAHLAAIVASADDAIASKTLEGIVTSWNASAERMFGYTAPEMIGQSILRIIPPERHNEEDLILARIRAGERVEHFETVRMAKDGRHIDVSLTISPIRDSAGTIIGASKIVRDITERKRVARVLQESEEKFRTLADHIPTLAWMARPDGHLFWYNRRWYEYTGTTPESQEGWGWQSVHDPKVLPQVMERWTHSITTGEPFEMIFPLKGADGVFRPFLTRVMPVKDEHGQVVRWFGVNADVTEQRQLQQRTRETLDALLHMARTLVAIPDDLRTPIQTGAAADGATPLGVAPGSAEAPIAQRLAELTCSVLGCTRVGITAVEPATERLRAVAVVGLTPEQEPRWWAEQRELEARGVRLGDGADPGELARFRAGEVFVLNMTQPPYDALPNPYSVTTTLIAPMRAGDRLVGMLSLDYGGPPHDFTDEERALASGVAQLGAVALERERLLRERAEAQATALALAEANRRMDEFLGIASHELRTPLTSIAANVQIAERALGAIGAADTPALSQKASGTLDRAHTLLARTDRQLARLDRLIGDLLDVSRIQAGKLEFRMEPCDLAEILRETVREQRATWPQRSITLALPRHLAFPLVADADRIGQVLTNYLTNALKYSPTDQPIVVRVRMPGGDTVRVEVRDSGLGLSTEQQAHLFEQFYRVPGIEQQSGSGVGLGLGLYICKTIIERHGGAVGVASAPGQGSTFWFTLPLS